MSSGARQRPTTCPVPAKRNVTARELLAHGGNLGRLSAAELEAWLVAAGLAVCDGRQLVPTALGFELGGALALGI